MNNKIKKKPGPKEIYSESLANIICRRVANGETLLKICKDKNMPDRGVIHKWLLSNDKKYFIDKYRIAKDLQTDYLFDECLEIADSSDNDYITKIVNGEEVQVVDHEHITRSRLKVDTRKWYIAKIAPKKYGDMLDKGLGEAANVTINIIRAA